MDKKILEHFRDNDPLLYGYAVKIKLMRELKKTEVKNYFLELCDAIVGQQLTAKAADAIFARFLKLFPKGLKPKSVFLTKQEKLRSVGLSNSKAKYLKNLAEAVLNKSLNLENLDKSSDEEIIKELVRIKGIGPWTAEMFLMFTLGRPDVFSHGDLGLKKGLKKIYGFKNFPSIRTVERIIKKWSPYKTYGSMILWKSLEI